MTPSLTLTLTLTLTRTSASLAAGAVVQLSTAPVAAMVAVAGAAYTWNGGFGSEIWLG